jgi:hypothetical protein
MFETPRYRVTGSQPVFDHQPGDEFEADLDPAQEQLLLAGGHLTRVGEAAEPNNSAGEAEGEGADEDEAAAAAEQTSRTLAAEEEE